MATTRRLIQWFSSAYYVSAGVGCLARGVPRPDPRIKGMVGASRANGDVRCLRGVNRVGMHCGLPAGFPLLLVLLLAVGFGSLGQFPTYYAFTQEISTRGMGKVTGVFSFVAWISVAAVQGPIGRWIDHTGSYAAVTLFAGLAPVAALLALLILWKEAKPARSSALIGDEEAPGNTSAPS